MSHREFLDWLDYFNRKGRCGPARIYERIDRAAALICHQLCAVNGLDVPYERFLPQRPDVEGTASSPADEVATVQDVFRELRGVIKR